MEGLVPAVGRNQPHRDAPASVEILNAELKSSTQLVTY